jgi:hypothetical protein
VLTLTGSFTLPTGTGSIVYTAPTTSTTANAVYATSSTTDFAATQTLAVRPVPAMVSVAVTTTTIAITYNESVTCAALGADSDFVYDYTGTTSGGAITGCTHSGAVLTLTGSFTLPTGTGSIVYTAPTTSTTANAVYATSFATDFAATQTLAVAVVPAMESAAVTTTTIAITYNQAVSCAALGADSDFVYDYTGTTSGGAIAGCTTAGAVLTLTGSFTLPTGTGSIVYTAPTTSTTANAVYATSFTTDFAATQTLAVRPVPAMVSAAVTTTTIAITYNESVTCSALGADSDFGYDYTGTTSGGAITGCTHSGAVLTLTGSFTLPTGTGSIVYTAPTTSTTANAVYATSFATDFAVTQTLPGSNIS